MHPNLKRLLRSATPASLKRLFIRAGFFFIDPVAPDAVVVKPPSHEGTLLALKRRGWSPATIIDVGAYTGDWTRMVRSIFPDAAVLMIEAQESKAETLRSVSAESEGKVELEITLLGATDGEEVRFVEMETGSSVFEEHSDFPRKIVKKHLTTLDSIVARHPQFAAAQFLKLDTQGYELQVLRGATRLVKSVDCILMEISFIRINAQAPVFADVLAFMASIGFRPIDFCSQIRLENGMLWQTDMMFARDDWAARMEEKLIAENSRAGLETPEP
jgi:FkbM family methyltransferase